MVLVRGVLLVTGDFGGTQWDTTYEVATITGSNDGATMLGCIGFFNGKRCNMMKGERGG